MGSIQFREVQLPAGTAGRMFLHSMPGRYEPLPEFASSLEAKGISRVICLVPPEEILQKSPDYAKALETGVPWTHAPMPLPDFGVPAAHAPFFLLAEQLAKQLREGLRVLVHCGAGIGRTGTFACVVLRALGLPHEEAISAVQQAHAGPETPAQNALVRSYQPGSRNKRPNA